MNSKLNQVAYKFPLLPMTIKLRLGEPMPTYTLGEVPWNCINPKVETDGMDKNWFSDGLQISCIKNVLLSGTLIKPIDGQNSTVSFYMTCSTIPTLPLLMGPVTFTMGNFSNFQRLTSK